MEEKYDIDIIKEILSERGHSKEEIKDIFINGDYLHVLTKFCDEYYFDTIIRCITLKEYNLKKAQKREQKINQILNDE